MKDLTNAYIYVCHKDGYQPNGIKTARIEGIGYFNDDEIKDRLCLYVVYETLSGTTDFWDYIPMYECGYRGDTRMEYPIYMIGDRDEVFKWTKENIEGE